MKRPSQGLLTVRVFLCCVLLTPVLLGVASAQNADPATKQKLTDAAKRGLPLQANLNVADNVTVDAVLLPERVCREVFGKEISRNYATIELVISNHSNESSLIVQSLYIDYSDWALSGSWVADAAGNLQQNKQQTYEATTTKNQIASVEYRIARGQMLDRQPWTSRNAFIRTLQLVGTIASAYVFTTTNVDITRGVNAFNGQVIPGLQTFWPDATIGQMNRISDVGFQVNKVIPKDSSDIVVAFFPIDRFLTPGLKNLFLKSPALFFAPQAMAFDVEARKQLAPLVKSFFNNDATAAETFMASLPKELATGESMDPKVKNILALLDKVSLNRVKVLVGGIMTVDVSTVPANIVSVELDGGGDDPKNWTKGDHLGTIRGSYLLNGSPELVGAPSGVSVALVQGGSTDTALRFKLTLPDKFLTTKEQKLTFKVTKNDKGGKNIESMGYDLVAPAQAALSTDPKTDASSAQKTEPAAGTQPPPEKQAPAIAPKNK